MVRSQEKSLRLGRQGLSFVETILTLILVTMLFYFGYRVMSHARRETQKGFWLQQVIAELRNGSRGIALRMKKTSYPTTIVKGPTPDSQVIMAYKELRKFDGTGRMTNLRVKSDNKEDPMDMLCMQGVVNVSAAPQTIMLFPICTPEKDLGSYEAGTIIWVEVILEPADHYRVSGLGRLRLIERSDTYNTSGNPGRAYDINLPPTPKIRKKYDETLPSKYDRVIVNDVENVNIEVFKTEEIRGIYVGKDDTESNVKTRLRYLVSMRIECSHPKDDNVRIGDQCSVVNHIDVHQLNGGTSLEVISVADLGTPNAAAQVSYNGAIMTRKVSETIGGVFRVTGVYAQGISVETLPGRRVRFYFLKKKT